MIIYVQWTSTNPQNWVAVDLDTKQGRNRWRNLAKKPEPTGSEALDAMPGWIFDLNVQGVMIYGFDHVACEPIEGGVRVSGWNTDIDDPDPQVAGYRWGEVWEFYDPSADLRLGGRVNTKQKKTIYTEVVDPIFLNQETSMGPVQVRPWSEFPTPPADITRHGIWVRDEALFDRHFAVRSQHVWTEWIK